MNVKFNSTYGRYILAALILSSLGATLYWYKKSHDKKNDIPVEDVDKKEEEAPNEWVDETKVYKETDSLKDMPESEKKDYTKHYKTGNHKPIQEVADKYIKNNPEDVVKPITIISLGEYMENSNYTKVSVSYYAGDRTLADASDTMITSPEDLVGREAFDSFGEGGSDDPDIVFVRNERLMTDYEIIRVPGKYSVDVLGIKEEVVVEKKQISKPKNSRKERTRKVDEEFED